jgi:hypothetical protein
MEGKWTLLGSLALGSLFATLAMVIPPAADPRASY